MQAQSRLSVSSGSTSSFDSADEHEAVVRELTHGYELTARLQAEAMPALRGQGQAEATAAFILREMSRAFTVCLSVMAGSAPRPETPESGVSMAPRRARDDSVPRKKIVTSTPHFDGYHWRKYGQKRIMKTNFPRCYYRCSYGRERNCPATKQVQLHSNGDPPMYVVVYVHEHTCHTSASEPEAANSATGPLDFSGRLSRQGVHVLDRGGGGAEEHERALVSSLARVLSCGGAPESSQGRTDGASATSFQASDPLPRLGVDEGLDVMDYDVTDMMSIGTSYGLRDDGMLF